MALEYIPLNDNDTKDLRKKMGLPVTKGLIYWKKDASCSWKQYNVVDYEIVDTYEPSGSRSILITVEGGEQIRILSDYLADMQKPSFISDVDENAEMKQNVSGKMGQRIEGNPTSYIVVDLETTGTNHFEDDITEIGAVKYVSGKEDSRFNVLVKTEVEIPKKVEKLTGISNDTLRMFGIEPQDAYKQLRDFLGNSVVIGHNFTTFDSKFLEDAYVRELNCHFPNDFIDTLYLAKEKLPNLKHHNLECLSNEYSIDYSKAHRAVEDCVINHMVYEYLTFGCLLDEESGGSFKIEKPVTDKLLFDSDDNTNEEELIEVTASEEWQVKLSSLFGKIEKEIGLNEHSFSIMANKGKNGHITSYAICVYEPDLVDDRRDSSRNTVLARVKENVLKTNTDIVEVFSKSFEITDEKKRFDKNSNEFIECLIECIRYGIKNYIPKAAGFACCSRYQECSKAKKCIHPNLLYAKACYYRKNIENGKIFY